MDTPTTPLPAEVTREGLLKTIANYTTQRQAAVAQCQSVIGQCDTAIRVVQGILDAAYPPGSSPIEPTAATASA